MNTCRIDRRSGRAVLGITLVLLLTAPFGTWAHTRITTDVNWGKNIREIMRNKCMTYHRAGGLGPDYVDLTRYGTDTEPGVRAWTQAILEEVISGRMPPWQADDRFSAFENERRLSTEEIELIRAWVEGGAPVKTRMRPMPRGPHFLGQWVRGDAPVLLPDSAGRLLRKGSKIELRIRYERPEYAEPEEVRDRSRLGLFLPPRMRK